MRKGYRGRSVMEGDVIQIRLTAAAIQHDGDPRKLDFSATRRRAFAQSLPCWRLRARPGSVPGYGSRLLESEERPTHAIRDLRRGSRPGR